MNLHLVNHVIGWTGDDGQLVMLWRVVDEHGKPLSKWTTHHAAESARERLYAGVIDNRQRGPEWDLMPC